MSVETLLLLGLGYLILRGLGGLGKAAEGLGRGAGGLGQGLGDVGEAAGENLSYLAQTGGGETGGAVRRVYSSLLWWQGGGAARDAGTYLGNLFFGGKAPAGRSYNAADSGWVRQLSAEVMQRAGGYIERCLFSSEADRLREVLERNADTYYLDGVPSLEYDAYTMGVRMWRAQYGDERAADQFEVPVEAWG